MSDRHRKIVVLGDSGVGKTSIVQRYVNNAFREDYRPTTGAQPMKKTVLHNGITYNLVIWDVAGHLLGLHPAYSSDAHGIILVCDMDKVSSADALMKWLSIIQEKLGNIPFVLAANKSDIAKFHEGCRVHLPEELTIVITSAKTGSNVDKLFEEMLAKII